MIVDTIIAIATPPGKGGVGMLRLSGPKSLSIACQITNKSQFSPRTVHYSRFYSQNEEVIDLGVAIYFKAPNSFTGEDVVELHAHGSPVVLDKLVKLAVSYGARIANPGEFSERAFLNDKIDLAQAEAIADLINSQSEAAADMAVRSLQGEFSKRVNQLVSDLIQLRMYVEAAIDFPEEEIDFLSDGKVANDLARIKEDLSQIIITANQGVILREGMSVVIAGKPNAGKSTLLNRLAGKELAIVTDVPGTTRDVMREHLLIDDIPLHVIDTAGLRDSDDVVEIEGIKRAWREIEQADCIILLMDVDKLSELTPLIDELQDKLPLRIPILTVVNKIDKHELNPKIEQQRVYLSAKQETGIELLKKRLKEVIGFKEGEGVFSARRRHLNALERAYDVIEQGSEQLLHHKAGELLAEDLRQAQHALNQITGEFTADDLLGEIFSSFCIGK